VLVSNLFLDVRTHPFTIGSRHDRQRRAPLLEAVVRLGRVEGVDDVRQPQHGPSHHGVLDLALCLAIPSMTVFAPSSAEDLKRCFTKH
jgi:hypothetical protein